MLVEGVDKECTEYKNRRSWKFRKIYGNSWNEKKPGMVDLRCEKDGR